MVTVLGASSTKIQTPTERRSWVLGSKMRETFSKPRKHKSYPSRDFSNYRKKIPFGADQERFHEMGFYACSITLL